ncbi:hypothetical protein EJ110_NYTH52424 [Nymphaea thermarum]|nr:hypothetical protein EJ110_NYTH52424 [Nymphaea thermarum]
MAKKVAMNLRKEWDIQVSEDAEVLSCTWVSNTLLRPFLFFITYSSTLYQKPQVTDDKCMLKCFKILLKSINLTGLRVTGTSLIAVNAFSPSAGMGVKHNGEDSKVFIGLGIGLAL